MLHAARWKCRTQKIAKNSPSGTITQLCRAMSSQLRHVSTIRNKTAISPHMSLQYGELRPTSGRDHFVSLGCGPSANLECRSEMCCTQLAGNAGPKNSPSGTIAPLCRSMSSQLRHVSTIGKKTC